MTRVRPWSVLACALVLAACNAGPKITPRPTASSAKPAGPGLVQNTPAPGSESLRPALAGEVLARVKLQGQVRLISDHGAGTISNATGQLISNNGGTLISNNGSTLVANNGGGLVSNNGSTWQSLGDGALDGGRYALAQAKGALAENPLAEANLEFLDAEGRLVPGPGGKALVVKSDSQGAYRLDALLPAEALVVRVRLYTGGQLLALLPKDRAEASALTLETNESYGAAYVLRRYLSGVPTGAKVQALGKLPTRETVALAKALAKARGVAQSVPNYQPEAQEASTESLRLANGALATQLEGIRTLLLAGIGVGDGQKASGATLSAPNGLSLDAQNRLVIVESGAGRVRRLESDGTLIRLGGGNPAATNEDGQSAKSFNFDTPLAIAKHPQGGQILLDRLQNRVYHLKEDGACVVLVGTGVNGHGLLPAPPREAQIYGPGSVAVAPDGSVYFGEHHKVSSEEGRLLRLSADGATLSQVPTPPEGEWLGAQITGLSFEPDGSLHLVATTQVPGKKGSLWNRNAAGVWRRQDLPPGTTQYPTLAYDPVGQQLLLASGAGQQIWSYKGPDAPKLLVGTGSEGYAPDGTPGLAATITQPGNMLVMGRRLVFTEVGAGLVRAIDLDDPKHPLSTLAGSTGLVQQGSAQSIGINSPSGIAVDAQGRVLIAEAASSLIKRLENGKLTVVVGSVRGFAGDGGPATQGRIDTPGDLVVHDGKITFLESGGFRLRQVGTDGTLRTLAGTGFHENSLGKSRFEDPLKATMARPLALAVGSDGSIFWTENEDHQIWRLQRGVVSLVAGTPFETEGETGDGLAKDALLTSPVGLAFGPDGALYFSDTGNMRIRRILNPLGEAPTVENFAGLGKAATVASFLTQSHSADGPRLSTPVLAPATLAFDAQGRLHFCEAGTARIQSYGTSAGLAGLKLAPVGCRIRRIEANGDIKTIAGHGTPFLSNLDAEDALLLPLGIRFAANGDLMVADSASNQVRLIPKNQLPE